MATLIGRSYVDATPVTDADLDGLTGSEITTAAPTRNSANIDLSTCHGIDITVEGTDQGGTPDGVMEFLFYKGQTTVVAEHDNQSTASSTRLTASTAVNPPRYTLSFATPGLPSNGHIQAVKHSGTSDIWPKVTYRRWKSNAE